MIFRGLQGVRVQMQELLAHFVMHQTWAQPVADLQNLDSAEQRALHPYRARRKDFVEMDPGLRQTFAVPRRSQ